MLHQSWEFIMEKRPFTDQSKFEVCLHLKSSQKFGDQQISSCNKNTVSTVKHCEVFVMAWECMVASEMCKLGLIEFTTKKKVDWYSKQIFQPMLIIWGSILQHGFDYYLTINMQFSKWNVLTVLHLKKAPKLLSVLIL